MSRSRKKTPICGHTLKESEKEDKKLWHRAWRRKQKQTDELIDKREVSNVWSMSKDGKQY